MALPLLLAALGLLASAAPTSAQDVGAFLLVDHWRPDEFGSEHGTNIGLGFDAFGRDPHLVMRFSGAYVFRALEDVDVTDYIDLSATLSYVPLSASLPLRPFVGGGFGYLTLGPVSHFSPILTAGLELGRGEGGRIALAVQYWTHDSVPRTNFALVVG